MRKWRPVRLFMLLFIILVACLFFSLRSIGISANANDINSAVQTETLLPVELRLDTRLPKQSIATTMASNNVNAKFGSRFDFVVSPSQGAVNSGTDGVYHDNAASYIVGVEPAGSGVNYIFHMGTLNSQQKDTYVSNEQWTQGLDTTRWEGDAGSTALHVTVDIIDTFYGEPGCTAIADCADQVRDDTVPVFLIGVTLHNSGTAQAGKFLFGSNRALPASNACLQHTTPGGTPTTLLSYSRKVDATGGTLFLAGAQSNWACNTSVSDRAGLAWNYTLDAGQSSTSYMLIGGWNAARNLFMNTQLPASCQQELLYPAQEWTSEQAVVDFAVDNLSAGDNLLGRAQAMENLLIRDSTLTPQQRWVIADSLHSYKSQSWLVGRTCAGGGYDAAVYEGSFGFLTTVDVMHEYGYFEINRVPWFFKSALLTVFKNATRNSFGVYFQHDQGGDINSSGNCANPGKGIPTIRATCYAPPRFSFGTPMPTEEDSNVALLTAYYVYITGDTQLLTDNQDTILNLLDAGMVHNERVGDPATGIAYNAQDTNTTYDDQKDCLHNMAPNSGNLYYQGLKEATAYRASAYLDSLIPGDDNSASSTRWQSDASKIEAAMVKEYNAVGYIPLAQTSAAYDNCSGRTVTTGEGLFYLHLMGLDATVNQTLMQDLASEYPSDLAANTVTSPEMISLESVNATGSQCYLKGVCLRYEWFSKVILSSLVADLVYTRYNCGQCRRPDVVQAIFDHDAQLLQNFGDGLRSNGSDWPGHYYPRGMISWAFLTLGY